MNPDPNPLFPYGLSFLSSLSLPSLPVTTAQQLPMSAFANATAGAFFSSRAFWGPVTATLDWCEVSPRFAVYPGSHPLPLSCAHTLPLPPWQANYQFSRYIAESANTFSNLFTIALAAFGGFQSLSQGLPSRYLAGWTVRTGDPATTPVKHELNCAGAPRALR